MPWTPYVPQLYPIIVVICLLLPQKGLRWDGSLLLKVIFFPLVDNSENVTGVTERYIQSNNKNKNHTLPGLFLHKKNLQFNTCLIITDLYKINY